MDTNEIVDVETTEVSETPTENTNINANDTSVSNINPNAFASRQLSELLKMAEAAQRAMVVLDGVDKLYMSVSQKRDDYSVKPSDADAHNYNAGYNTGWNEALKWVLNVMDGSEPYEAAEPTVENEKAEN